MSELAPVITIDGPSGTGKGTISLLLAKQLNWHFLDSGALYRIVGLSAFYQQISSDDETRLAEMTKQLTIVFQPLPDSPASRVFVNNSDVTETIRTEEIGNIASLVSRHRAVRNALIAKQVEFRRFPGLIADGRDMGTVIFPDAGMKFFLSASAEERARRRYLQLKERGINVNLASLLAEIIERDRRDQTRQVAPLKPADDAIVIDTTELSIEAVCQLVLHYVQGGLAEKW